LAAYTDRAYNVTGTGDAERLRGTAVDPSLFQLLGVAPAAGRFVDPNEGVAGADRVVVLSHGYWQRRFGGRFEALGQMLSLDGVPREIIGVAPPGFSFPDQDRQLYTPFVVPRTTQPAGPNQSINVFTAIGRLADGVTTAQAEAEGTNVARGLGPRPIAADLLFGKGGPVAIRVRTIVDQTTADVRPTVLLLVAGATLVLLLGCANVANLLLSRGIARERELAVRAAIGAGRGRLVRQMFAESLVLALAAASVGVGLAWGLVRLWPALVPRSFPRIADVQLDEGPLLFALAASVLIGSLVGIAPALHGSRTSPLIGLRNGPSGSTSVRSAPTRRGLIGVQAAFAVILLVGAMLLLRSFDQLLGRDTGYDAADVVTARVALQGGEVTAGHWQRIADGVLERVRALPHVESAGAANMAPLGDTTHVVGFRLREVDRGGPDAPIARALGYIVTPGYAEALHLRLVQGRLLAASDVGRSTMAMLVNEEFVRMYLQDGRPVIGRTFTGILGPKSRVEVIGVIKNVLKNGLADDPQPEIYVALGNHGAVTTGSQINLVIRTAADATVSAESLRAIGRDVDAAAPIHNVRMLQTDLSASVAHSRFATTVVTAFAALAAGLAAIGLYGGLMYAISRRTRELGIRASLGASRHALVVVVVREGLVATLIGLIVGLGVAASSTRMMSGLLFEIHPLDAVSFAVAPVVRGGVAASACILPALRVTSIAPMQALRQE
jgi:predicted permease